MTYKTLAFIAICFAGAAHAGPYGDDMARCLVDSTTKDDRIALVRWMFAAAAANPAVAPIAKVSQQTMDDANATMAALMMRLLTDACREKTKKALKYEGGAALQLSFQTLGQVAAGELFSSPEVKKAMSGLETGLNNKKLEELKSE
jgi:hypothetical protein